MQSMANKCSNLAEARCALYAKSWKQCILSKINGASCSSPYGFMGTHPPGHIIYGYTLVVPMKQIVFKKLNSELIYSPWYCEFSLSPAMRKKKFRSKCLRFILFLFFILRVCLFPLTRGQAHTHARIHTHTHTQRQIKRPFISNKKNPAKSIQTKSKSK